MHRILSFYFKEFEFRYKNFDQKYTFFHSFAKKTFDLRSGNLTTRMEREKNTEV